MSGGGRAQKTTNKTALGGLPAPVDAPPTVTIGPGGPCRGCGEAVGPDEKVYTVKLLGALTFDFHAECYETWKAFKPRPTKPLDSGTHEARRP
jgi:hypothetical protein